MENEIEDLIPNRGDHGGPLVTVRAYYEDGTEKILKDKKIMAAISRSQAFNPMEHMKNGKNVVDSFGNLFNYNKSGEIWTAKNHDYKWHLAGEIEVKVLLDNILANDLKPYTEPVLEDGLYFVQETDSGEKHCSPRWLGYNKIFTKRLWFMGSRPNTCEGWDLEILTPQTNPATNLPWRIETPEDV